jgi:hypothetical protein
LKYEKETDQENRQTDAVFNLDLIVFVVQLPCPLGPLLQCVGAHTKRGKPVWARPLCVVASLTGLQ